MTLSVERAGESVTMEFMASFADAWSRHDADADVLAKLKASLAFIVYAAADHDYYPIVSGFHLGNPNMPMILDAGLGNAGCVFPSHPASGAWLARGQTEAAWMCAGATRTSPRRADRGQSAPT